MMIEGVDLKITEIRWAQFATDPNDRVFGMCRVLIDDCLVINEVRVINGRERVYVAYPNKAYNSRHKNGAVYPIDDELRREWESVILADFEQAYMNFFGQ